MNSAEKDIKSYSSYLFDYYSDVPSEKMIFLYEGDITHQVVLAITSLLESVLIENKEKNKIQKKIFNILVEVSQNIFNHGSWDTSVEDFKPGKGCILVYYDDKFYHIISGNVITTKKVVKIKKSIDIVNLRKKEELRESYKYQLSEGRFSEKGGAGLGFIDMARKSGNKIGYKFIKFDENISFFINSYKVSK